MYVGKFKGYVADMKPLRLISGSIPVWKIRLQTILHICLEPRTVGHSVIKASKG